MVMALGLRSWECTVGPVVHGTAVTGEAGPGAGLLRRREQAAYDNAGRPQCPRSPLLPYSAWRLDRRQAAKGLQENWAR